MQGSSAGIALVAEVSGPVPNYSVGLIGRESGASRLEIVQSRGWHMPPRVAEAFDGFAELLSNANSGVNLDVRERLGRIVEVHPEGSLTVVLGEQFTAGAPDSVADAVSVIVAVDPAARILICGSLYLAGRVLRENG